MEVKWAAKGVSTTNVVTEHLLRHGRSEVLEVTEVDIPSIEVIYFLKASLDCECRYVFRDAPRCLPLWQRI